MLATPKKVKPNMDLSVLGLDKKGSSSSSSGPIVKNLFNSGEESGETKKDMDTTNSENTKNVDSEESTEEIEDVLMRAKSFLSKKPDPLANAPAANSIVDISFSDDGPDLLEGNLMNAFNSDKNTSDDIMKKNLIKIIEEKSGLGDDSDDSDSEDESDEDESDSVSPIKQLPSPDAENDSEQNVDEEEDQHVEMSVGLGVYDVNGTIPADMNVTEVLVPESLMPNDENISKALLTGDQSKKDDDMKIDLTASVKKITDNKQ